MGVYNPHEFLYPEGYLTPKEEAALTLVTGEYSPVQNGRQARRNRLNSGDRNRAGTFPFMKEKHP